LKKEEVEAVVAKIARRKVRQHRAGKVVIYGHSVAKVKKLAEQLACNAYYHDAVGKASMLADFMAGKQEVIVATSALGMGVDIPDIRCIIHMDWPWTILDYAQESGRAGRDGLPSEAIIIGQEGSQRAPEDKQSEAEQQLVQLYVAGNGTAARCRRWVLDEYLDGREGRVGCEEGEEKCDVCRGAEGEMEEEMEEEIEEEMEEEIEEEIEEEMEEEMEETEDDRSAGRSDDHATDVIEAESEERQRVFQQQEQERRGPRQVFIQQRQQEFGEVEWLRRQLAWWANRCGICEAAGDGQSEHDVRRCWRQESRSVKEKIKTMEEQIRFESYSGCFWCGVPQEICNRWEENGRGRYQRARNGYCQYQGVLIGGLIGVALGSKEVERR
jgi:superfamily II DNA helicase RecQ